ncbi:MAG: ATP synthase F1 subunit gamma [Acidobacteriota bacterium]
MANRRVLVKRRKSIRNIRKITRTMQLIATARFQAAYNRAVATKPYNEKLAELVADLSSAAAASGGVEHPLLKENDSNKTALVTITSTRGLCGGYNSSVLRASIEHLDAEANAGHQVDVHMAGKKGISYFRFLRREMKEQITSVGDVPRFDQVEPIANALMDQFIKGEIRSAYVSYMKFVSTGTQRPVVVQLLPLARKAEATEGETAAPTGEVEFSPDPQKLLDSLLPASVRVQLFQAFTDAVVSEQVARMVAMKAATDAAGDMIKSLTREYNRARQTAITMELLDIVGGANALA